MPYIDGASGTSTKANVDTNYNLLVNFPISGTGNRPTTAGFTTIQSEVDAGIDTGIRLTKKFDASYDSKLRVGIDTPLFLDRFVGSGINSSIYTVPTSGMTVTQGNGFITLNASGTTGLGAATLQTRRSFPTLAPFGVKYNSYAKFSQTPVSGNITEWGFGISTPSGVSGNPSDGAFFRYSGTNLYAVTSNSSSENISGISASLIGSGLTHQFKIDLQANTSIFEIDNNVVAYITSSGLNGSGIGAEFTTASAELPAFFRTYNYTTASPAQQMSISAFTVNIDDSSTSKSWASILDGMGGIASQTQNGQSASGSTALYPNSVNPTGFSGTNTVAVLGSGIGGQFMWSGTIGSSSTDYIISSYQIPTGSNILPGKCLYIHGINVSAVNFSGVGNTPISSAICAAYGHTSESLATAESANTKAPRFVPLGVLSIASGSTSGVQTPTLTFPFVAPIVVNPTEYFAITSKFVASQGVSAVVQYNIGIDGYWE